MTLDELNRAVAVHQSNIDLLMKKKRQNLKMNRFDDVARADRSIANLTAAINKMTTEWKQDQERIAAERKAKKG